MRCTKDKGTAVRVHTPTILKKSEAIEQKGKLLIRDFLQNEINSVHDMHVMNTYAKPHLEKTPEKCLKKSEK